MGHGNPGQRHLLSNTDFFYRVSRDLAAGRADNDCQQGQSISMQRSSGPGGFHDDVQAKQQPAEPLGSPKEGQKSRNYLLPGATANTLPAASKKPRQPPELEETQEQMVAVARGGVRYAGKVFHRKGVKLTEDSPRSMLPRDVSPINIPV